MLNPNKPSKPLSNDLPYLLKTLQISVLSSESELVHANELLEQHHYLGSLTAVGERMYYSISDENGDWLAVMVFVSAARRLRHRDAWIGWTDEQRRRRLQLVVNNARFLLLPERTVPNLGSAILKGINARLSADWQERYGHPVLVVETFVDPSRFSGTVYTAAGWKGRRATPANRVTTTNRTDNPSVCLLKRSSALPANLYTHRDSPLTLPRLRQRASHAALKAPRNSLHSKTASRPKFPNITNKPAPIRRTRCSRSWLRLIWREPRADRKTWLCLPKVFRSASVQPWVSAADRAASTIVRPINRPSAE